MSFLAELAALISALPTDKTQRVAIDGADGVGKTTLANQLKPLIEDLGRPVIRASVDGFHHPREIRYRMGKTSPEGFFRESYNYPLLKKLLLDPLSPGGDGKYRTAAFNVETDESVAAPEMTAEPGAILLIDGIFLHRLELRDCWDFSLFLRAPLEISIPRGAQRGSGSPDPTAASNHRYVEGQKLYFRECRPEQIASLVVDYADLGNPRIV